MIVVNKAKSVVRRLRRLIYYYHHRLYFGEKINWFNQKKSSDTAFLIATGPSIKRQDLSLLKGQDCYTISNAYLHKDIEIIKPIAHGFAAYHQPMDRENYIQWLKQAEERLPRSTVIYTDYSNRDLIEESSIKVSRSVIYGFYDSFAKWLWPKYCKSLFLPPQSGPLLMLPLIVSLGYKKICLLGCDHTTLRNYGKHIENFYPPKEDPRTGATDSNVWTDIVDHLKADIVLFEQYRWYATWLEYFGIEVVNLSDDSWLNIFPISTIEIELQRKQ